MAERKAVIKNADMSEDMQQDAVDCASQALEKYNIEKVRNIPRFVCFFNLITLFRILRRTSKKNLTRNIIQLGIASSVVTLDLM